MNRAAPELVPLFTTNPGLPLNTIPVGPPGTLTSSGIFAPAPVYSVDVPETLFADHHGVVGPATSPHAFTRSGSVVGAIPGWSETSGVTSKAFRTRAAAGLAATSTSRANTSTAELARLSMAALLPRGATRCGDVCCFRRGRSVVPRYYGRAAVMVRTKFGATC
jgi:hypothetical protein